MTTLSYITKQMLNKLPSWTKMRKDPESVGAQFLNVFGLTFEDIDLYLSHQLNNQYIGSANLGQIDILYKADISDYLKMGPDIFVRGDTEHLIEADTVQDFYEFEGHPFLIQRDSASLYVKHKYSVLRIIVSGEEHIIEPYIHHVWNSFDEFGLLLGLKRIHGEPNADFRARILDVFLRPGNATKQGLQHAVGRVLSVPAEHIRFHSLGDAAFVGNMLNSDGSASQRLRDLVGQVSNAIPVVWENAVWDKTYWQVLDSDMLGLHYLPHIWDATTNDWDDDEFQSGVGDGYDLSVELPEEHKDTQEFNYYVGLQGTLATKEEVYAPHQFRYAVQSEGVIPEFVVPGESYYITVVASEIVPLIFTVRGHDEYDQAVTYEYGASETQPVLTNTHILPGNKITSIAKQWLKLRATLSTNQTSQTPRVDSITIYWKDNLEQIQSYTISEDAQWAQGTAININRSDDSIEMARGSFNYQAEHNEDWAHGELVNINVIDGKLRLIN